MKASIRHIHTLLLLLTLSALNAQVSTAFAQGTAFTYQGQLQNSGSPTSGSYDLAFTLYNTNTGGTAVAGPVTNTAVNVTNGLFTVTIDFGASVWNGASNWLEIGVSTNGANAFITLLPRQQVTPTPYAITAENVVGLTVQENTNGSPNVIGGSSVNYVSNSVYGATIGGGGVTNYLGLGLAYSNSVTADFGTVGGGGANTASGWASTVGGGFGNTASSPDGSATVGGGYYNTASGDSATVGGGYDNTIYGNAPYSMIGGGLNNQIYGDTNDYGTSVIVGGYVGTINSNSWNSFIGGGAGNTIGNSIGTTSDHSVIVGGNGNLATGSGVFIGGGTQNSASGSYSTVPGGVNNNASGDRSFAAGDGALAAHYGSFVWADASGGFFSSTATNQFSVRANGGVQFVTAGAGMTLDGQAVVPSGNYVFAVGGQQTVAAANTYQDITFDTDAQIDGWQHTAGEATYTNAQTGLYMIQYTGVAAISASSGITVSMRAVLNGSPVSSSSAGVAMTVTGQASDISRSFLVSSTAGDTLKLQLRGSSTSALLTSASTVGPAVTMTIVRIQ